MNILDIAIAKKLAGGGGGSGTDNYNDLSNLPKINDTTLSGNKTSANLGLQSEINSDSKLASDLVDDTNQDNKFVTSAEKTTWNGKQNAIDADHKINADYVDDSTSTNKFVTADNKETWNAKQNAIDNSHKLSSDLVDDANHTNKFVTSTEKQTWNAKQNAIDADHKLSSSLVSFTEAEAAALASGIDSSKVGQISTNQTNILSVQEADGQKNFFPYFKLTCGDSSKLSFNEDGTITSTITSDSRYWQYANREFEMTFKPGDYVVKLYYDNNGSPSINQLALIASNDQLKICGSGNNWELELHVDATVTYGIMVKALTTSGSAPTVFRVMVCTKSQFNISSAYQPYALPNYDLTRLEAEDRASLAEVVDSGAKNLLNCDNATIAVGAYPDKITYTRSGNTITVTSTGAPATTGITISDISNIVPLGVPFIISGCPSGGGDDTYRIDYFLNGSYVAEQTPDTGSGSAPIIITNASGFYIRIRVAAGAVFTNKVFKLMICTKAAFGVSQKFVPYRLPYDELIGNTFSGDFTQDKLDNLATGITGGAVPANLITGITASSWVVVHTYRVNNENTRKLQVVETMSGTTKRRTYENNTWSAWS